ncbi:CPBP family intramembrane glutamic endopeptidase [Clostridium autoethanogenum]|uniref:CPBP family intramembrane metalloprotease n=1 Tax=Clostridium autoethanogenum DSM 10061 TaxID=1341692 RepID=A0ABM5NTJ6_9CLOT|nr:CPBP family intramembrane glutamic endopeptidase [Clostridium autoethanogenum]AGY75629.1 CPBP family intramembrane metalloprotease [Clostridium autoethanogenum DSM 10061]ALU35792.1 Abortive infection protein [Clostridium autoethanogenum DSM 10061]OVY52148.1 CAAX amino terminal protease self- immunity [Clostridium autoethanogenum]
MVVDGLVNAFINITLFIIVIMLVKKIESIRNKDYTPVYWISLKKHDIKLFVIGIIVALLYKLAVGSIGIIGGTMELIVNGPGMAKFIIFTLASSFGFLGVALFEEGLYRGYVMQVAFRKLPKVLAIVLQALVFGLVHYSNYSKQPHTWIRIIDAILIGVIFGVIVIKTKSLMFTVGTHLFYDATEQMLFLDNPYKFTRFICFQNTNYLSSSLFYTEFIELSMLSILTVVLIFLFRKNLFYDKSFSTNLRSKGA